jgi:hypothetical protein
MVETTTKRKGRPARDSNNVDTQSNVCIITDPVMEPFYISKDNSNFTVVEKTTAKRGFRGAEASGKESENVIGYYSNFRNALNSIAKQKFYVNKGHYSSIKEYIDTWNDVKDGINNLLNKVEI